MEKNFFKQFEKKLPGDGVFLKTVIDQLQFNEQGLIPAIAQQHCSGAVLMLAWMNRQALQETLETGRMCYWSRSRQTLWRKGESSGNTQRLVEIRIDCDGDTLLCLVDQTGPACHTNRISCFYLRVEEKQVSILTAPDSDATGW